MQGAVRMGRVDRSGKTRAIVALMILCLLAGCASRSRTPPSRHYYHGPVSSHFDGERFFNPDGETGTGGAQHDGKKSFLNIATGRAGHHDWPKSVPVHQTVPPRHVLGQQLRVTWIGHATTLIQTQGLNILIDPVWTWRDSPVQFLGPRRVRAPGVRLQDLPPIDAILISHNHYDHLDIGALKFIVRRDKAKIITGLGNDRLLSYHGLTAWAGDWGSRTPLKPGIDVVLTRAHHWSAHWIDDIDRSLWTGFRITLPGGDVYYAGDTGPGDMKWAPEGKGEAPVRLALLPIAPYKVSEAQTGNHILPEEAVKAFEQLGAAYALGVHWGTFELGPEPIDGAPTRLRAAMVNQKLDPSRFKTLDAGEIWSVPEHLVP